MVPNCIRRAQDGGGIGERRPFPDLALAPASARRPYTTWRLLTSLVDADVQEEGEGVSTSHGSFNLAHRACRGTPERLRQRLVHVTIEVDESLAGWASYMSYEAIVSPRRI